jgi:peptidoglycan/xylan/chitin deacetylase (PgdA/CDA1 family)
VDTGARGGEAGLEPSRGDGEETPLVLVTEPTIVSLTLDDCFSNQYAVRSMLARRSMHATFYVNSALVGLPGRMKWGQLFDLAANGHEIGGHGVEHVQLTALSEGEAAREISDDRQALISHGFDTTDFAYPYGTYNKRIGSIVQRCGYRSARRSWGLSPIGLSPPDCNRWYPDVVERIPPEDRYAVRTIVPVRAWHTLGDIQSAVTRAERNGGGWVILVFHRICDGCDPVRGYSVSPSTFARLLDWLEGRADRGTHVLTVQDVISEKQCAARGLEVV